MKELSRDLLRVSRKAQMCAGIIVKKYNLSVAEEPFFMAISFHNGATQEELTAFVGVDKAMTTRVIHSLIKKGFVEKIPDTEDKRRNRIYKTDKMEEVDRAVVRELLQLNQVFMKGIEEEDLNNFLKTLASLEENISGFLEENE